MTSHESLLVNVDRNVTIRITMGNGQIVKAIANGTLMIETKNGTKHIKEVMLMTRLDENLLSVKQMMQHGYVLLFGDAKVAIFEDRRLENYVVTTQMIGNRCFPLLMENMNSTTLKATIEENAWVWHMRLGHLNFQRL